MKLSEFQEQCLVVQYLDILKSQGKIVMYTSIPNSTWTPSWSQKRKNRKSGLNPGFPDLFIITPKKAVAIEMKVKGNYPSPEQKEWAKAFGLIGIPCYIAYGFNQAKEIIDSEL